MNAGYIIGGEYLPQSSPTRPSPLLSPDAVAGKFHPGYHITLTGGGYYSLKVLLHNFKKRATTLPVLLPSYLCPDIILTFREMNVEYEFYPVNEQLQVDLNILDALTASPEKHVLYIIPWFGLNLPESFRSFIQMKKKQGLSVWEDRAQCLFPAFETLGDAVFYSFRKFLPFDGSLLLSKTPLVSEINHYNETYLRWRRDGQILRNWFVNDGYPLEEQFLECFRWANETYHQPGIAGMDEYSMQSFQTTDFEFEIHRRRKIFACLHERLNPYAVIRDPDIDFSSPLCYPVRISGRDSVLTRLKAENIFAPVLWSIGTDEVPAKYSGSHQLSSEILCLPIRTHLPDEAYHFMADRLLAMLSDSASQKFSPA
jgi:hypothetical protein